VQWCYGYPMGASHHRASFLCNRTFYSLVLSLHDYIWIPDSSPPKLAIHISVYYSRLLVEILSVNPSLSISEIFPINRMKYVKFDLFNILLRLFLYFILLIPSLLNRGCRLYSSQNAQTTQPPLQLNSMEKLHDSDKLPGS
jgi:hypothetical protein